MPKTPVTLLLKQLDQVKSEAGAIKKAFSELTSASNQFASSSQHGMGRLASHIRGLHKEINRLQNAFSRISTTSSAIGGANVSGALASLTGGSFGRGGGFVRRLENRPYPTSYQPISLGGVARGVFGAAVGANVGRATSDSLGGGAAGAFGGGAAGAAVGVLGRNMVAGAGMGYLQQAIAAREQFESATRRLPAGSLTGKDVGGLTGSTIHGFDIFQGAAQREALMRAFGGGNVARGSQFGQFEGPVQAMANRLRVNAGALTGAAAAVAPGGMDAQSFSNVLQRLESNLLSGISSQRNIGTEDARQSADYLRASNSYLASLVNLGRQQIAITGTLSDRQITGFQSLIQTFSNVAGTGTFTPEVAGNVAGGMVGMSMPQSGAAEMMRLRSVGFANPLMGRYRETAKSLGMDQGMFKRRGYIDALKMLEDRGTATKMGIVGLFAEHPNADMGHLALLAQARGAGGGIQQIEDALATIKQHGFAKIKAIPSALQGMGTTGEVAETGTVGMTGTGMGVLKPLIDYNASLVNLSNAGGEQVLEQLNKFIRGLQRVGGTAAGSVMTAVSNEFKPVIDDINVIIDRINKNMGKDDLSAILETLNTTLEGVSAAVSDLHTGQGHGQPATSGH